MVITLKDKLATFLAGRYVEIPVYTLSYREFMAFRESYFSDRQNKGNLFLEYLRKGGFPVIHTADYPDESAYKVVYDIYSSVILRDTIQRYKIRDVELLERVIKYAFDNIGNTWNSGKVIFLIRRTRVTSSFTICAKAVSRSSIPRTIPMNRHTRLCMISIHP